MTKTSNLSLNEAKKRLDSTGWKLVNEKQYISFSRKILMECKTCGIKKMRVPQWTYDIKSKGCRDCYFKRKTIRERISFTCIQCGIKVNNKILHDKNSSRELCKSCNQIQLNKTRKLLPYEETKQLIEQNSCILLTKKEDYINRHANVEIQCGKCSTIFSQTPSNYLKSKKFQCPACSFNETVLVSNGERELADFISSNSIKIERSKRKILDYHHNAEIDIFIPEKNLGIEFDGLRYHSSLYKSKDYHLNKTNICDSKGISLIHVFEDEWSTKKEIVKSIIMNKLGLSEFKLYARQCEIKELNKKQKKEFLECNHIQGQDKSNIQIGLFYNNQIVSAMTFTKSRFNKNYEWEISRFCNLLNYSITGAFSRLLSFFEKKHKPKSLITYADRRYSKGNVYLNNGFILSHTSSPNYYYVIGAKRENRINWQKHKLKSKLKIFDEKLTEWQNMESNGYYRIFDSGNLVFTKNYSISPTH